jgi:hypothetical protein
VREAKRLMREGGGRDPRARFDAEKAATRAALAGRSAADLFAGFGPDRRACDVRAGTEAG